MPDYKELFYKSQAEIADTVEMLEAMTQKLIACMQYCEERVTEEADDKDNIEES